VNGDLDVHLDLRRSTLALDARFAAPAGVTTALLGPNGAGKSTALAAVAGLLPLDAGHVRLGTVALDEPATDLLVPASERRVGVVFQDGRLFDHLTVRDNVAFGPRSRGASRTAARAVADGWLDRVWCTALAERRPPALSGGEAQRVALARALATDPDLLLLDEPFAALDVSGRADLRRTLADHLAAFAGPRLVVTHDPLEAFLLADLVHVLEDGRITQSGTPDELRLHPATPYVADLAGTNLLEGRAEHGVVDVGGHRLRLADDDVEGQVLVTLHPRAVSVHAGRPAGSPRNVWQARVERLEHLGGRVRLQVGAPLPLTVELTADSVAALRLAEGATVWLAVKATELHVVRAGG
jgi:molybdate transport system ATP-binding protein